MEAPDSNQAKNLHQLINALGDGNNGGRNFNEFLEMSGQGENGVIHLSENLEMSGQFESLEDMVSENPITLDDIEQILGMPRGSGVDLAVDLAQRAVPRSHSNSECQSFYATSPESGISGCHDHDRSPMNGVQNSPLGGFVNGMDVNIDYNAMNELDNANINNEIPNDLDMSNLINFPVQNLSRQEELGLVMIENNHVSIPNNQLSFPINQPSIPMNQGSISNSHVSMPMVNIENNQVSVSQNSILLLNCDPYLSQAMAPATQFHPPAPVPNQPSVSLSSHSSPQSQDIILSSRPSPQSQHIISLSSHPSSQTQHNISLSSRLNPQSPNTTSLSFRPSPQSQHTISLSSRPQSQHNLSLSSGPQSQHTLSLASRPQSQQTLSLSSRPQSQHTLLLSSLPSPSYQHSGGLLNQNMTNFSSSVTTSKILGIDDLDDDTRGVPMHYKQASQNKVEQVPDHIKEEFSSENAISVIRHSIAGSMSLVKPRENEIKSDHQIPATVQVVENLEQDVETKIEVDDIENVCDVCREAAGKHSYYGGKVCPSCRAFFRRSVQSKYYEIFFCKKDENCVVILKTRKNCQFCRFKKCLEAGMRTTWVLSDEERNRRFNKFNKLSAKTPNPKDRSVKTPNPKDRYLKSTHTRIPDLYMAFTMEEQKTLESIQEKFKVCKIAWLTNLLIYNFEAGLDFINVAFNGGKMKYKTWMSMAKSWEILFVQKMIYAVEEELSHLPQNEQAIFFNGRGQNSDMAHNLKAAVCMLREDGCPIDQQTIESARIQIAQQDADLADRLGQLSLSGKPQMPPYKSIFYDRWANNISLEQKHLELTMKIQQWPEVNQEFDINMLVLLLMVVLFNPDSYEATVHKSCEKIQLRYTLMLQRYLQSRMPSTTANNKFVEGLLVISYSKEISELSKMHVELAHY